ncbi:MAG: DUF1028 domain-containing protein, partial [Candidatus Tectomicrobia bacterium]|nr:DUF1028 domain-containing protein [Candidatus Tectomicrobia bacterium]
SLLKHITFVRGTETHTFTALGRCPHTGRLGVATTTSEMGVGSRVPYVQPHVGAVATQAYTDPRLGQLALQLLALGYPAARVVAELASSDPHIEWRQLGIVDRWGHVAAHTGTHNTAWAGHHTGEGWITMGNVLVGEGVVQAMAQAMQDSVTEALEVRLMRAIEAGTTAGGQPDGQRSAALLVYENTGYAIMNLRVDDHPTPTQELWRLFNKLYPLKPYYQERPDNPSIGRVGDWARARGLNA